MYDHGQAATDDNYFSVDEAFAIPEEDESLYDTAAAAAASADAVEEQLDPLYDAAKSPDGAVDDVAGELMALMTSEAQCIYDVVNKAAPSATKDPEQLVAKLNEHDKMVLRKAAAKEEERPSWTYYRPSDTLKKANIEEMKAKYGVEE